jgi:hypothetical protein
MSSKISDGFLSAGRRIPTQRGFLGQSVFDSSVYIAGKPQAKTCHGHNALAVAIQDM